MAPPADTQKSGPSNLQIRLISAAVLLPVVTAAIYFGHPYFTVLIALFAAAMAWEWTTIVAHEGASGQTSPEPTPAAPVWWAFSLVSVVTAALTVLYAGFGGSAAIVSIEIVVGMIALGIAGAVINRPRAIWFMVGILYVAVPAVALIAIRADPTFGRATLIWIIALVVAADTGGYIAGRSIGGPKLVPRISPNKTWAGLAGAVVGAALVGLFTAFMLNHTNVWVLALLSAALGVVEQAGDLVESAFKRHFGVKDTSHIIPGHGGVLDRVDGLLAVAVAVLVINEWAGGSVLAWS
jgi:phosphatidate cytidylyltransferase